MECNQFILQKHIFDVTAGRRRSGLRDEGEAFGNKLRQAGVPVTAVRFQGTIHDFVMLNPLSQSQTARGAIMLATGWLHEGFTHGL